MKKIVAAFLLFFFTAISFQQLTVITVFVLNQDFITENFCINKDKPEMQCKGKCHLKDTLAQTTPQNNKTAPKLEVPVQFPVFISESFSFQNNLMWRKFLAFIYTENMSSEYTVKILHPPPMA